MVSGENVTVAPSQALHFDVSNRAIRITDRAILDRWRFESCDLNRRNPKGDGGKGTGKKTSRQFATDVTTIYDMLRQFATFYDNFCLFVPLS